MIRLPISFFWSLFSGRNSRVGRIFVIVSSDVVDLICILRYRDYFIWNSLPAFFCHFVSHPMAFHRYPSSEHLPPVHPRNLFWLEGRAIRFHFHLNDSDDCREHRQHSIHDTICCTDNNRRKSLNSTDGKSVYNVMVIEAMDLTLKRSKRFGFSMPNSFSHCKHVRQPLHPHSLTFGWSMFTG